MHSDSTNLPTGAVLFDMDGVVVTTEALKATAHAETVRHLGGAVKRAFYGGVMGGTHEIVRAAYMREGGIRPDPTQYTELYGEIYRELVERNLEAVPGVLALLKALRKAGFRTALVTSSRKHMVEQIFRLLPLAPCFDVVLTAEDTPRHKPDPDPYLLGLDRLVAAPEGAVVFEDSDIGASAAVAAGIPVVAYRHEFNDGHAFNSVVAQIDSFEPAGTVVDLVRGLLVESRFQESTDS